MRKKRTLQNFFFGALVMVACFPGNACYGATYTVISATDYDSGGGNCVSTCSLRDAINEANTNAGEDIIQFAIPGSGIQSIQILDQLGPLPTITDDVTIDGATQDPSSVTPAIEIRGNELTSSAHGLHITADGCEIKGLIINGFMGSGIKLDGADNTNITFNWIGIDTSGGSAAGNYYGIELVNSTNNNIGGGSSASRNVISGNSFYAIIINDSSSSGNSIKGNYIGTDISGTIQIANVGGITIYSDNNTVGGNSAADGNVIAGAGVPNLALIEIVKADGNSILNNKIGTDANATASFASPGFGILLTNTNSTIVGAPGAGNVISGNLIGIYLRGDNEVGFTASNNKIQANLIGTDGSGLNAIPNSDAGIVIEGSQANAVVGNLVGGDGAGEGNVISGNGVSELTAFGIYILGQNATKNIVEGNYIGTAADGVTALANTGAGVFITDSSGNRIGGAGAGNVIANNYGGVAVSEGSGNTITQNKIYSNTGIGINLIASISSKSLVHQLSTAYGPDPNDKGDEDQGGNDLLNFPEFTVTVPSAGEVIAKGKLDAIKSTEYTVEFFSNSSGDESGFGEGEVYLDSEVVTTNEDGEAFFSKTLSADISKGEVISATATDPSGSTSEFSLAVGETQEVIDGGVPEEPPAVSLIGDDAIISVQAIKFKLKKKKKARAALQGLLESAAKTTGSAEVKYQVSVINKRSGDIRTLISKRNVLTFKNLPAGNYNTRYTAMLVQNKQVIAKTKKSPATIFAVRGS